MLTWDNKTAYLPEWLEDIYGMGEAWPADESPSNTLLIVLITTSLAFVTAAKIVKAKKRNLRTDRKTARKKV